MKHYASPSGKGNLWALGCSLTKFLSLPDDVEKLPHPQRRQQGGWQSGVPPPTVVADESLCWPEERTTKGSFGEPRSYEPLSWTHNGYGRAARYATTWECLKIVEKNQYACYGGDKIENRWVYLLNISIVIQCLLYSIRGCSGGWWW